MTRRIAAVLVASLLAAPAFLPAQQSGNAGALPKVKVTVMPVQDYIPAHMANGRPVYEFAVRVTDPHETVMIVSARTLLQAGDSKTVRSRSRTGEAVAARISISPSGIASYHAEYACDGRAVAMTSADIHLGVR